MDPAETRQRRLTSRELEAQGRRERMTRRRQNLTSRIRKQKKSDYLAKKRGLPTTYSERSTLEPTLFHHVQTFCSLPSTESLQALSSALEAVSTSVLPKNETKPLVIFPQTEEDEAVKFLQKLLPFLPINQQSVFSILIKLTSFPVIQLDNYYGIIPATWSTLLAREKPFIMALMGATSHHESANYVLGNMVGDASSEVLTCLKGAGLVLAMVKSMERFPSAASWALTNAIRHDTSAWASTYCDEHLLSPALLERLMRQPDVGTQAAWMVASLTDREPYIVHYLAGRSSFLPTLLQCLNSPVAPDQVLPIAQAMVQIASQEQMVAPIVNMPDYIPTVCRFLSDGNSSREIRIHMINVVGCLLCDAGLENHPSSTIAAPALLPMLSFILSNDEPFDLQREAVNALWNALAVPPSIDNHVASSPYTVDIQVNESVLETLVSLMKSPDADAVLGSANVVELLLRRDDRIRGSLESMDIATTLESICESSMDDAATVAADLLDDYFYPEDYDDQNAIDESTENDHFAFNPPTNGMGRGRGATLPSWMSHN